MKWMEANVASKLLIASLPHYVLVYDTAWLNNLPPLSSLTKSVLHKDFVIVAEMSLG